MTNLTPLDLALDLLPEAWHDDIANDAESEGYRVGYTAAAGGLRTATIRRVQRIVAEREGDADWESMGHGRQLDEVFPDYNGIGSWDLLDELGITTVYVPTAD
ncbi:hypothetical protein [Gordonia sp. VNK21]|uniref:hypothetical protein n=1 Tax=Gordonia sp. VNK21 TaxID=3382483 RepID=UPI0038D51533